MSFELGGPCPKPFLRELDFPPAGGFVDGRMCFPIPQLNATCCVPCPMPKLIYGDGFQKRSEVANWMNLAAACATAFLLLSFMVLDVKWTHRHYLSVCLAIGVLFMELAFILPLITTPEQCHNDITPNGMHSDLTCAFSGAFLLFGGWAAVIWVFWRALSLHLQICWEVIPGPKFFYSALVLGWGVPAVLLATTLSLTGVSYRFGNVCHINHELGMQDFWGPLLSVAALAMILQFLTIGYCVQVFVRSLLMEKNAKNNADGDIPSIQNSFGGNSGRKAYRRIKRVIELQWRGASVVLVILGEVIFFSVIFVSMDNNTQITDSLKEKASDWVVCLIFEGRNSSECLALTSRFVVSEGTVLAVLICLALSGFWCLLFLGRWSMVLGWRDLIRRRMLRKQALPAAHGPDMSPEQRSYQMLDSSKSAMELKVVQVEHTASSPRSSTMSTPVMTNDKSVGDNFNQSPSLGFRRASEPRDSEQFSREPFTRAWDPTAPSTDPNQHHQHQFDEPQPIYHAR